jgi:hypothetical protein
LARPWEKGKVWRGHWKKVRLGVFLGKKQGLACSGENSKAWRGHWKKARLGVLLGKREGFAVLFEKPFSQTTSLVAEITALRHDCLYKNHCTPFCAATQLSTGSVPRNR